MSFFQPILPSHGVAVTAACITKGLLHRRCCAKYFTCITPFHLTTNLLGPFHRLENGAEILSDLSNFTFLRSGRARFEFQATRWLCLHLMSMSWGLHSHYRVKMLTWSQTTQDLVSEPPTISRLPPTTQEMPHKLFTTHINMQTAAHSLLPLHEQVSDIKDVINNNSQTLKNIVSFNQMESTHWSSSNKARLELHFMEKHKNLINKDVQRTFQKR